MRITYFFFPLLTLSLGLAACRNQATTLPTLTPVPTPDATLQADQEQAYLSGYENGAYYSGIAAWGNQVYFGYGKNLYWLDVSDPENPILSGREPLPNPLSSISLQQGVAHLILNTPSGFNSEILANGWQQMDISNPPRPRLTTFYDAPFNLQTILIYRDRAFLGAWEPELHQLEISDAAAPRTYPSLTDLPGNIFALGQYDHYLLVETASCFRTCNSNLLIIDAQDPDQLRIVAEFPHYGAFFNLLVHKQSVTLAGTVLLTLDLSDPTRPQLMNEFAPPTYINDAVLNNNILYTSGQGLAVYDLTRLDQPQLLVHSHIPINTQQIALDGDLLALSAPQDGIFLFSIADPTAPQELTHFKLSNQDLP